jgi:hypothetical protein
MRIYQAGVASYGLSYPILMDMLERREVYTLESFWYTSRLIKAFEKYPNFKIFLDSGAYSWDHQMTKQGKTVTEKDENDYLNRYIEFIKKYEDRLYVYANLDFVGDPEKTQRMQDKMEAAGLHPTPVFHYTAAQGKYGGVQEEHFKHLKRIVERYDYLALGGGVSGGLFSYKYMTLFGKKAWKIIKSVGRPIKVHGFGLTSVPVMLRYDWYSVDSTNWIKSAAYGIVYMPRFHPKTHEPLYHEIPRRFAVSAVAKHKDTVASHYENEFQGDKASHKEIEDYFESIGIDMEKMEETAIERVLANFKYFNNFLEHREKYYPNGIVDKKSTNKFF